MNILTYQVHFSLNRLLSFVIIVQAVSLWKVIDTEDSRIIPSELNILCENTNLPLALK